VQNLSRLRHEKIHILADVDKNFVLPVLDPFVPPVNFPGNLGGDPLVGWLAEDLRLQTRAGDVHLQDVHLRDLGVPVVHDFIDKLLNQHEVFLHVVFVHHLEIRFKYVNHLADECEYERRVHICARRGNDV
jgi:hypothetical protein